MQSCNGNEKKVKLIFNNTIEKILKLDNTRKMYISNEKEKDITIIGIKEEDNYDFNNMLEIDYDIFENEDLNKIFKSIYIVHYPFGKEACFTMNVIENIDIKDENIKHKCATDSGASGAPIINMKNCKVIGIHRGEKKGSNINVGTLLKESIINFNKNKNGNKSGILYYKHGRYEGEVKNGKREGKGIMYYNNGDRYEGDYKNDKKEGKGIYYFINDDRMMGDYANDEKIGKHVKFTKYGEVKILKFY